MKNAITIIYILIAGVAFGQSTAPEDIKLYYRSSYAIGGQFHTAGFGFNFKKFQHLSYKSKRFFGAEFLTLKHPKQKKVFNGSSENSRGYHYGKVNHFMTTRVGIGQQNAIALKELKKGVQVAWIYSFGGSLGILKPIYVKVYDPLNPSGIITEQYNPEVHNQANVVGAASFFYGLDGISLVPGAYGKLGLNFENSPYDDRVKSIETGIAVDAYFKKVPLMYAGENYAYWLTFYVLFEFGKKIE